MRSILALSLSATVLLGACTVVGMEFRSMPTVSAGAAHLQRCPDLSNEYTSMGVSYSPRAGGRLCFSAHGVEVDLEAENTETTFLATGVIVPVFPFWMHTPSTELSIALTLKADEPYAFDPWSVSVQTDEGETIAVSPSLTRVPDIDLDPTGDPLHPQRGARPLRVGKWDGFALKFEQRVAPEQAFSLTLHLVRRDGADVQLPTIRFEKGMISFAGVLRK